MKYRLSVALLFFVAHSLSGQELGAINDYLKSPQISSVAKQYYQEKFKASDNDSTDSIIDSINTKNNATRPFYLLLASKMIPQSDGALSEVLFLECEQLFENKPDAVVEFLYGKNALVKNVFKKNWANAIVGEIAISHEKEERQYLKTLEKSLSGKCHAKNRKKLSVFFTEISKQLEIVLGNSQ